MPRRNVSISEKHLKMLKTLEETGVAKDLFGRSWKSAMYQYIIEKVYRERFDPKHIELEKSELELKRASKKTNRLEKRVKELRDEVSSNKDPGEVEEDVDRFFAELVTRIENKASSSKKSFEDQYLEWEEGNVKAFNNKFYKIHKQSFRKMFVAKAEESGHDIELELI